MGQSRERRNTVEREEDQRQDIRLENIMHPGVSVTSDTPAREVLKIMLDNKVPGVTVLEDGRPVGFITDGVLLASALPKYLSMIEDLSFVTESGDSLVHYLTKVADKTVLELMSPEVSQIELGTSELEAARKMVREGVSSVVVTENGKMVGLVTRLDLYSAIVGLKSTDGA